MERCPSKGSCMFYVEDRILRESLEGRRQGKEIRVMSFGGVSTDMSDRG